MTGLRIGMMDLDQQGRGTRFPNLAQMKISSWCKAQGHDVSLIWKDLYDVPMLDLMQYDVLVVSKVFDTSPIPPALLTMMGGCDDPLFLEKHNLDIPSAIKEYLEKGERASYRRGDRRHRVLSVWRQRPRPRDRA